MVCKDFQFNNCLLSDFGMNVYDPENSQEFTGREMDVSEISAVRSVVNHYSTRYSGTLVLSFLIIKDEELCPIPNALRMTSDDINLIRSWLESPKVPSELLVLTEYNEMDTFYYGVFTDIQPFIVREECYGLYLTFTCNAPYGFTPEIIKICPINSSRVVVNTTYQNKSAEHNDYLKPVIRIYSTSQFGDNENIEITNLSDDGKTMALTMPKDKKNIYIDCDKKFITDESGDAVKLSEVGMEMPDSDEYSVVSTGTYSMYWLRFVPGGNNLQITPVTTNTIDRIEFGARQPRKPGGF